MKKERIQYMGLLGVISFLSYLAAVIFSPMAYPGYDWMNQAVSDLSAANSPSLHLWNQLSCLYEICGMISIMMVCVAVKDKLNKLIRTGIYIFAIMNWISAIGYNLFPLSESGHSGNFQDTMHLMVTGYVVILSIASLVFIIVGGIREEEFLSYSKWAATALFMMVMGALLTAILPPSCFGIAERLSVFSATGFNALLGLKLWNGKIKYSYTYALDRKFQNTI